MRKQNEISTSVDASVLDPAALAEGVCDLLDLLGEFAGRREDEDNRSVAPLQRRLVADVHHPWQQKLKRKNRSRYRG